MKNKKDLETMRHDVKLETIMELGNQSFTKVPDHSPSNKNWPCFIILHSFVTSLVLSRVHVRSQQYFLDKQICSLNTPSTPSKCRQSHLITITLLPRNLNGPFVSHLPRVGVWLLFFSRGVAARIIQ